MQIMHRLLCQDYFVTARTRSCCCGVVRRSAVQKKKKKKKKKKKNKRLNAAVRAFRQACQTADNDHQHLRLSLSIFIYLSIDQSFCRLELKILIMEAVIPGASVALIFAGCVGAAYVAERIARSTYILGNLTHRAKWEIIARESRTRKQLDASAQRARAAGKVRDAAVLEKAANAAANECLQAKLATVNVSLTATALRNGLLMLWLLLAGALWPSGAVLVLPVPAVAPLSWLTHLRVEGDDYREVGTMAIWLVCSALATQVLPWLLPADADAPLEASFGPVFWELFTELQARNTAAAATSGRGKSA